jgi:hypothetical protein
MCRERIPKRHPEGTKGVIRRYQRVGRGYQRGNQKVPKGQPEGTRE